MIKTLVDGRCPRNGTGVVWASSAIYVGALPPDGFEPGKIIQCISRLRKQDGKDGKVMTYRVEELSAVPTPALLDALRLPDGAPGGEAGGKRGDACPMRWMETIYLLLVNSEHRGYQPRIPTTFCSEPRPEILTALADIRWAPVAAFDVVKGS